MDDIEQEQLSAQQQNDRLQMENKAMLKEQGLSGSNIKTIQQFRNKVHNLQYPYRLRNSHISIRSLLTFFYDYTPDKVLSLKISDICSTEDQDLLIFSIQQNLDIPSKGLNKKKEINTQFSGLPMHQEIVAKQVVAIYDMINSRNHHKYIKNPYTLNINIYSNGFPIGTLIFLHSNILQQLKNSFNLYVIDAFFNLYTLQDILKYNDDSIRQIKNLFQAIDVPNTDMYVNITLLNQDQRLRVQKFINKNTQFAVSRYCIQDYLVLFTTMSTSELKDHIQNISGTNPIQFYPHSFNLLEQRLGIYTAVYQGFLISNIFTQNETISYNMPDGIRYQFDLNSIYYMLQLQLILKRLLQIDFQQPEALRYVELIENIYKPTKDQIVFNQKIEIPAIVQQKKKFTDPQQQPAK